MAEANAKIKIVNAEADAKAYKLRQQSLTPLVVQQMFIEKWDGKSALYGQAPAFFKQVQ